MAAGITGVALLQRGPDLSVLPDMAAEAVTMPDGRKLYAQRHEVTIAEWNKCAAEKACEGWKEDKEDCIFDVMATRDIGASEKTDIIDIEDAMIGVPAVGTF